MKIIKIEKENVVNGPGIRTVVWISGCPHHCEQCFNPETWSYDVGSDLTKELISEIINATNKPYIRGITLTGGDPLSEKNRESTFNLLKQLKSRLPDKDFWCWTGHIFEEIYMFREIEMLDVIVDGKFDITKKDLTLPWRGSSNQRVIDVRTSLEKNQIVKLID